MKTVSCTRCNLDLYKIDDKLESGDVIYEKDLTILDERMPRPKNGMTPICPNCKSNSDISVCEGEKILGFTNKRKGKHASL